jgi:ribosomal protein S14
MFDIKAHDRDRKAHTLIDRVNELERRHADAVRLGNTTIAAKLQRRIKVIDRQAWNMSSDDSNQCDNCGTARSALNCVGLCAMCASTVEEQHG